MNLTEEEKEALRIFHANKEYSERLRSEAAESNRLAKEMALPRKEHLSIKIQDEFYIEQTRKDQLVFNMYRHYDDGGDFDIELSKEDCIKLIPFLNNFINKASIIKDQ